MKSIVLDIHSDNFSWKENIDKIDKLIESRLLLDTLYTHVTRLKTSLSLIAHEKGGLMLLSCISPVAPFEETTFKLAKLFSRFKKTLVINWMDIPKGN